VTRPSCFIKPAYKAKSQAGLRLVGSSPLGFDSLRSGRSRDAAKLLYKAESKAGLRLVGSSPLWGSILKSGRSFDAAKSDL
jgi:hypothetical protein